MMLEIIQRLLEESEEAAVTMVYFNSKLQYFKNNIIQ
jgi:hypothetical protein